MAVRTRVNQKQASHRSYQNKEPYRGKSSSEHSRLQSKIAFSSIGQKEATLEPKGRRKAGVDSSQAGGVKARVSLAEEEERGPRMDLDLYPPINPNIPLADQLQISDVGTDGYQSDENTSEYQRAALAKKIQERAEYEEEKRLRKEELERARKAEERVRENESRAQKGKHTMERELREAVK